MKQIANYRYNCINNNVFCCAFYEIINRSYFNKCVEDKRTIFKLFLIFGLDKAVVMAFCNKK